MQPSFQFPGSVNTSAMPSAVTATNGSTYVFYKGVVDDPGIYVTRSLAAVGQGQWTQADRLPPAVNTSDAPSAVNMNDMLYVAYKGAPGDSRIYVLRSADLGLTWYATQLPVTVNTSTGPDAYVSGNTLYIFYKGAGNDESMYLTALDPNSVQWNLIS